MQLSSILNMLEEASGRNQKEDILRTYSNHEGLLMFLNYALDPYKIYHIAKIEMPTTCAPDTGVPEETYLNQLWMLLEELKAGNVVGNEARLMISVLLSEMPQVLQKWAYRCLLKDLKIGVTGKTVNKIIPFWIPSFEVALAKEIKLVDDKLEPPVTFPVWVDYKLDGIRAICEKRNGVVTFYTRNGNELDTLPTLKLVLENPFRPIDNFILDGEVRGRSWNVTQSILSSSVNTEDDIDMYYNVFDSLTLQEWDTQNCTTPYMTRRANASKILETVCATQVRLVGGELVNSVSALKRFYMYATSHDYEGIMVKNPTGLYQFKRSKEVMKLKPKATWDGVIVGWSKGDSDSKWANGFGAFDVSIEGVITSVGGGYTDEMRLDFYSKLCADTTCFNGQLVEVEGQELTEDGKVRFPVFKRWLAEQ
jgi:DNA ligase 1